jgi:hypothetical protein
LKFYFIFFCAKKCLSVCSPCVHLNPTGCLDSDMCWLNESPAINKNQFSNQKLIYIYITDKLTQNCLSCLALVISNWSARHLIKQSFENKVTFAICKFAICNGCSGDLRGCIAVQLNKLYNRNLCFYYFLYIFHHRGVRHKKKCILYSRVGNFMTLSSQ